MTARKPNILVILTDQQRFPPVYENEDLRVLSQAICFQHLSGR